MNQSNNLPLSEADMDELRLYLLRDRLRDWAWDPDSATRHNPGSLGERIYDHNRFNEQHPKCIRRVYWLCKVYPYKEEDEPIASPTVCVQMYRCDPGTLAQDHFYNIYIEAGTGPDDPPEAYRTEALFKEEDIAPFDLIKECFGPRFFEEYGPASGKKIEYEWNRLGPLQSAILIVQEQMLQEEDDDWEELFYSDRGHVVLFREYSVVEVIQTLYDEVQGRSPKAKEYKYIPMPRYSKY